MAHVACQINHTDLRLRSVDPYGSDEEAHGLLLICEDMLDKRAPLRPPAMDAGDKAPLLRQRRILL